MDYGPSDYEASRGGATSLDWVATRRGKTKARESSTVKKRT